MRSAADPAASGSNRGLRRFAARLRAGSASVPALAHAVELQRRDRQRAGSLLAAGIAARTFLMLLPLAFLLAGVIGFLDQTASNFSVRTARAAGLTANLVAIVSQSSGDARRGRWVLLMAGAVLLLYAAYSLYRALFMTHLVVWGMTDAEIRPSSAVLASFLLVLLPVVFGLASLAREAPASLLLLDVILGVVLYSLLWLWISCLLPRQADRWTALVPGSLVWGVCAVGLQLIAIFVLSDRVFFVSRLYGTLAIASTTIAWLFLVGRLTVAAATLNALMWDRKRNATRRPTAASS